MDKMRPRANQATRTRAGRGRTADDGTGRTLTSLTARPRRVNGRRPSRQVVRLPISRENPLPTACAPIRTIPTVRRQNIKTMPAIAASAEATGIRVSGPMYIAFLLPQGEFAAKLQGPCRTTEFDRAYGQHPGRLAEAWRTRLKRWRHQDLGNCHASGLVRSI